MLGCLWMGNIQFEALLSASSMAKLIKEYWWDGPKEVVLKAKRQHAYLSKTMSEKENPAL